MHRLTQAQVSSVFDDKETMYGALLRNQRWTQNFKKPIMTTDIMRGVKEGEFWLPKD